MLRRHRFLTALVAAPVVGVLALVGLTTWWLRAGTLPLAGGTTWMTVQRIVTSDATPRPGAPVFLLAVGTDARTGETVARGDAIHVIGVNPATGQATILDIPRDTGAAIPGRGTDKINAAMSAGGAELLARTVSDLVGVPISYVITTDFDGFIGMVDGLGGVTVNVTRRSVDPYSGANFEVGTVRMNGTQALAFNRNRHSFPTGDLQRSENQGYFILQALAQLRAQDPGPGATLALLGNLGRHARLVNLGWADAYRLGRLGLSLDPANVENVLIPVGSGVGSRLQVQASAAALFADFRDDAILQSR